MVLKAIFLWLKKTSTLVFLTLLFFLFNVLLNYFLPSEYALDLKFAYSVDQAYQSLGNLSLSERNTYKFGIIALDFPYMLVYGLLSIGLLRILWKSSKVAILPLGIFLMDFFENILIIGILIDFPERHQVFATLASIFTTSKWMLVGLLAIFLLVGLINHYRIYPNVVRSENS